MADSFEERGVQVIERTLQDDPEVVRSLVSVMRREDINCTGDEILDRLVERLVAGLRRGTPDEGKPLVKRMH